MTVESAEDLAVYFDTSEFAEAAIYKKADGSGATSVAVIVDDGLSAEPVGLGGVELNRTSERTLRIQAVEVEGILEAGGTITLAASGKVYTVADWSLEKTGKVYLLDVGP